MREWLQETRYAVRVLAGTPGFAAVAVLSLALGIGANTAVFMVAHKVLFEPLPVVEPERLVVAYWRRPEGLRGIMQMNSSDYRDPATGQSYASNYFPSSQEKHGDPGSSERAARRRGQRGRRSAAFRRLGDRPPVHTCAGSIVKSSSRSWGSSATRGTRH